MQWGSHGGPAINTSDGAKHAECVLSSVAVALPTASFAHKLVEEGGQSKMELKGRERGSMQRVQDAAGAVQGSWDDRGEVFTSLCECM